jgi:DNA-binding response OmpR family regulator/drug/metabolite transporter (DMT)-like permease
LLTSATVLVVDSDGPGRRRLMLALKPLGHAGIEAATGAEALDILATRDVDLILLDVVMPGGDGFDVLRKIRSHPRSAIVPVIVVSGIEGDTSSVARAIQLGAEDFLPKSFDAAIFRARVNAGIEKRRLRAAEVDVLQQVEALTRAAEIIDGEAFHPKNLGLDEVAARPDALGRLASVVTEMAQQVYDRERALQRQIRTIKGTALVALVGLLSGLSVPLAVLLFDDLSQPVGVAFWINLVSGVLCLGWSAARGRLGGWTTWPVFGFLVVWALLASVGDVLWFEAAGRVSGILLSLILVLEGFAVFLIATALRTEHASFRRFLGLALGFAGVALLLTAREQVTGGEALFWIAVALSLPVIFAVMNILLDLRHPETLDPVTATGVMSLLSALMILPVVLAQGQMFFLHEISTRGLLLILGDAVVGSVATVAFVYLVAAAGAVFGSQAAYSTTLAGIGWSMLILGEPLSIISLGAILLVFLGLMLVGPKREAADVEVPFVRRSRE